MLDKLIPALAAKTKLAGIAIAAAALGGTAAVAGPATFSAVSSDTAVVEEAAPAPTEPAPADGTTTGTEEGGEVEVTETEGAEATPEAPVVAAPCPADVKNHGAYVSSVARDKTLKGKAHGQAVSAAAKSDCGKKADAEAEAPEAEKAEKAEKPAKAAKPAKAEKADKAKKAKKAKKARSPKS